MARAEFTVFLRRPARRLFRLDGSSLGYDTEWPERSESSYSSRICSRLTFNEVYVPWIYNPSRNFFHLSYGIFSWEFTTSGIIAHRHSAGYIYLFIRQFTPSTRWKNKHLHFYFLLSLRTHFRVSVRFRTRIEKNVINRIRFILVFSHTQGEVENNKYVSFFF